MFFNKNKKFRWSLFLILSGFFLSVLLSSYYINKYDNYTSDGYTHQLIKDETYYHWRLGDRIAEETREGKNFFLSGDVTYTKPLHQRIVALYSLVTGYDLIDDDGNNPIPKVNLGGKLPFLIFQSFIYFFSLFYFSKSLIKIVPEKSFFYIILFLSIELTIFQYHSSFWTESIYFSLQLIIFGKLLEKNKNFFHNFIIGLLVGFAFLQRSGAIFYILPILICYSFLFKKKIFQPFFGITTGYTLIAVLIGSYNFYKTNTFYIYPSEGKYAIHTYFCTDIIAEKFDISVEEARLYEVKKTVQWAKKNNLKFNNELNLDKIKSTLELRNYFLNEYEKNKYFDYLNQRQFEILFDNPIITSKKIIEKTLHLIVLNPTFNYFYNEYRGKQEGKVSFVYTETHKKLIPFRIFYTLIIYLFSLLGFIYLFRNKKYYELCLISLSILYYIGLFGWYGKTRLYVPALIYLSVFFGIGVEMFINNFKKK